jgi:hypothetical protein
MYIPVSDLRGKPGSCGMTFTLWFRRGSFNLSEEYASLAEAIERARLLARTREGMYFRISKDGKAALSDFEMAMKLRGQA